MGLTYRDKDQLLQLAALLLPTGVGILRDTINAPARQAQEARELDEYTTGQELRKLQIKKAEADAAEPEIYEPEAASLLTGIPAKDLARIFPDGKVPSSFTKLGVQARYNSGRVGNEAEKTTQSGTKVDAEKLFKRYEMADSAWKALINKDFLTKQDRADAAALKVERDKAAAAYDAFIAGNPKLKKAIVEPTSNTSTPQKLSGALSKIQSAGITRGIAAEAIRRLASVENDPVALKKAEAKLSAQLRVSAQELREIAKYYNLGGK